MIRAERPREITAETSLQENKIIDETRTQRCVSPSPVPTEDQLPDESGCPRATVRSRTMHPDSARYASQPAPPEVGTRPVGSITCPQCSMENVATGGRRFCGDCGTSLWEKCHGCGSDVSVDERFCGQCGLNMAESVQEQERTIEEQLARADQLGREHRFSEAKVLLSSIVKAQNPRLKEHVAKAEQKLQQIRLEHERWEYLAGDAHKRAQKAFSLCDFDDVIAVLEEIPSPIRSTPIVALLKDARARKAEVEELARQLRELLADKRGSDVLPVIERLQRLQPNHPLACKIATCMRDQLVTKTKQRVSAGLYDEASRLLERIPTSSRTTQTETLLQDVEELSALYWDANHCQYVDDMLGEVLKRLVRHLPSDTRIRKLVTEYGKRRRLLDASERTMPVPWVSTTNTPWKCPVEWMVGPERIEMDEISPAVRRDTPGAFAVAFGLALQGIGKGPVHIDFTDANSGVMGRMARLMRDSRHGSAWGIDIGDHTLKAVKLSSVQGGQRVVATACEAIPHRKLLSQTADYGEARDLIEETFNRFRDVHALKGERLCLALSSRLTICRVLHLPAMADKKIEEAVRFEAQHVLPGDLDDYCWRKYRPESGDEKAADPSACLLFALTRRHLKYTEETCERLHLQPDVLQTEYLALHNYLGFELETHGQNGDGRQGATVLLDMGAGGTCMIVHSPRCLWGRYLGVGGHTFSRAIVREFHLTLQQAEDWKRDLSRVDRWSRWESVLSSVFASFSKELTAALNAFAKDYPCERIERIVTVGGGMEMHGLLRYLRTGR